MELQKERLSSLQELLRRADRDTNEADEGYRRKPRQTVEVQRQNGTAPDEMQAASSQEDWTGTLDLVLRAGERLVASEKRVGDLETEVRELTETASQEIQQLRAEVAELHRQVRDADAGRLHAEDWLRRLTDAIREQFTPQAEQDSETAAA